MFSTTSPTGRCQIANVGNANLTLDGAGNVNLTNGAAGNFTVVNNNAFKPGGGAWAVTSDERIKTVTGEYEAGLDEVLQLRPVTYVYKGNDTPTADGMTPAPARRAIGPGVRRLRRPGVGADHARHGGPA